jgi:hypothetical protein
MDASHPEILIHSHNSCRPSGDCVEEAGIEPGTAALQSIAHPVALANLVTTSPLRNHIPN